MKKAAAWLISVLIALPAFAFPVCAATCGGGAAVRTSCCCGAKEIPNDGNASYTASPCCPSDSARADLRVLDTAFSAAPATLSSGGPQQVAASHFLAAATATPVATPAIARGTGGPAATGPPLFQRSSTLRL
jgi:hypothetical protein